MPRLTYRRSGESCELTGPHYYAIGGIGARLEPCCFGVWGVYLEPFRYDWDHDGKHELKIDAFRRISEQNPDTVFRLGHSNWKMGIYGEYKTLKEWERDQRFLEMRASANPQYHGGPHILEDLLTTIDSKTGSELVNVDVLKPCCLEIWTFDQNEGWIKQDSIREVVGYRIRAKES